MLIWPLLKSNQLQYHAFHVILEFGLRSGIRRWFFLLHLCNLLGSRYDRIFFQWLSFGWDHKTDSTDGSQQVEESHLEQTFRNLWRSKWLFLYLCSHWILFWGFAYKVIWRLPKCFAQLCSDTVEHLGISLCSACLPHWMLLGELVVL